MNVLFYLTQVIGNLLLTVIAIQILLISVRYVFNFQNLINIKYISTINILILIFEILFYFGYGLDFFFGWYSGSRYEDFTYFSSGKMDYIYILFNIVILILPFSFIIKRYRSSIFLSFFVNFMLNIMFWYESIFELL